MVKTDPQFEGLSAEAKRLHARLVREWRIRDAAGLTTLMVAMQAFDRLHEAQKIITKEGCITFDRFHQAKPNPATQVEKEARAGLLMALRHLNLDLDCLDVDEDAESA